MKTWTWRKSLGVVVMIAGLGLAALALQPRLGFASSLMQPEIQQLPNPDASEKAPAYEGVPVAAPNAPEALGDLIGSIDVASAVTPTFNTALGVEDALGFYWVTGRSLSDEVKKLLKFNRAGALIAQYVQEPCGSSSFGYRDLAFDGTFLWAADECGVDRISPSNGVTVGGFAIPAGAGVVRALAFDPALQQFYTANFNSIITVFDMNGTVVRTMPANGLTHYGFGWDNRSPGGPYLWSFIQNNTAGNCTPPNNCIRVTRLDPNTGVSTGVMFDGVPVASNDLAGGADVSDEIGDSLALVTLHQSNPDSIRIYDLAGPAGPVVSAVSRKVHGSSGTFDIDLPLTGAPGVECRTASTGAHRVVVKFSGPVTLDGFTISGGATPGAFGFNGSEATLTFSPDSTGAKRLVITLQNVTVGGFNGNVTIPMNLLVGDTNGNGTVNASDIGQTKAASGQAVSASNARLDVTVSGGSINASDIGQVKATSGATLP
jgi:hypothetical protein